MHVNTHSTTQIRTELGVLAGKKTKRIEDQLMTMLEDEDRVVRESACLSLAHMRCQRAVSSIVDLWWVNTYPDFPSPFTLQAQGFQPAKFVMQKQTCLLLTSIKYRVGCFNRCLVVFNLFVAQAQ